MPDGREDAQLVQAALAGDGGAYEELARRYRDAAFGIAFHRLGDFEAARDVAQEALVTAYVELPMLREPAKFAHWLARITTSAAITELRRRRPTLSLDAPETPAPAGTESDPAAALARAEKAREVRKALAGLPEPDRLAVILHYVNGYSHAEIGGILGTTVSAVKSRVHRARRRLRKEMLAMVESNLKSEAPGVEFDEKLARVALRRYPDQHGGIAVLETVPMPIRLAFTARTRKAIRKVASELAGEGYSWLISPYVADCSPGLTMLKHLGFGVMMETQWYERTLKGRLPKVPELREGLTVRPLVESDAPAMAELLQSTVRGTEARYPDADQIASSLRGKEIVHEASLAAFAGDQMLAVVEVAGCMEAVYGFEAGTALLAYVSYHADHGTPEALAHLLGACLRPLKEAGFRQVVARRLQPRWPRDQEVIALLERLKFRRTLTEQVMKLDLKAWAAGTFSQESGAEPEAETESRSLRPLPFSTTEMAVDAHTQKERPELAEALQVRINRVLGTSPLVGPGEVYVVTGEYTLRKPVAPYMTVACDGTSTGGPAPLQPGTHDFSATTEVRAVNPGMARVLHVNLMDVGPEAVTRVRIDLES
ncbi:MAG: RNA polymerase sigma factor [Armatimonadetes bacterium]|nr:RNA polymerase sigma factor [Armatimonadota bacterium]